MKTKEEFLPQSAERRVTVDELESRLRSEFNGRVRGMRLLMRDGGLVLRGRARSFYVKQLAQHLLMRTTSLPILANEIEVA